ncbi:hypothetical protein [Paracoccus sp. SSK6]|uniref:hypothetical protein n=1 Tax=Paracoccus sp. SSK6 TaxID=3143131 RepID=UPI00321B707F
MEDENQGKVQDDTLKVSFRRQRHWRAAENCQGAATDLTKARDEVMSAQSEAWEDRPRRLLSDLFKPQKLPPPDTVAEAFERTRSLVDFANVFSLDRRMAIRALATAGIDIQKVVALEWERGCSVRELSHRHAVTRSTIGRWIKKGGRDIYPRNGNRKHDEDLIVQVFLKTGSANRAAQAANVHWATARRILQKHNLWHGK